MVIGCAIENLIFLAMLSRRTRFAMTAMTTWMAFMTVSLGGDQLLSDCDRVDRTTHQTGSVTN